MQSSFRPCHRVDWNPPVLESTETLQAPIETIRAWSIGVFRVGGLQGWLLSPL